MVFSSFIFLFWFLPLFLAVYRLVPGRLKNACITVFSFVFYGWWRPHYVFLMLASVLVDWRCAKSMAPLPDGRSRRAWLLLSIVTNLGLLGWFKYANLAVATWNDLGIHPVEWTEVVLPVGISFYTFQSMSYTIDVYRRRVAPARSFGDLLCFVTMFPQLVAGPIVRYQEIEKQIGDHASSWPRFRDGTLLAAAGIAKKVLIADQAASIADQAFSADAPGLALAWLGVLSYAVQIYFDFSGYSDMAIGFGRIIGFDLPTNFLSPYKSKSITEFWRAWHVSLSSWLRDYLYVPLGGNRRGTFSTYRNLLLTMLLGGLWHGAQWTFVLWGAWQGAFLVLERAMGKRPLYSGLPGPVRCALTFAIVLFGWAIFRAQGVDALLGFWGGMIGVHGFATAFENPGFLPCAAVLLGSAIAFTCRRSEELVEQGRPWFSVLVTLCFFLAVGRLLSSEFSPFLYYRF
ncbi:MAG: hypothetical protein Fur0037_25200 [Planctomycetota bacterium]